jgi:hypothetical protein
MEIELGAWERAPFRGVSFAPLSGLNGQDIALRNATGKKSIIKTSY